MSIGMFDWKLYVFCVTLVFFTVYHEELTQRKTLDSAVISACIHMDQIQSCTRALQNVFSCKYEFEFL